MEIPINTGRCIICGSKVERHIIPGPDDLCVECERRFESEQERYDKKEREEAE